MTSVNRIITALIACMLLGLNLPARAEGIPAVTGRDNAVVYNADGDAIGALPMNTALTVEGVKGGVCRVSYRGRTGYMKKSDLVKQTAAAAPTGAQEKAKQLNITAYVAKDDARVYNARGKVVGTLSLNAQVTVTAVKGELCRIRADGRTGYMYKSDLSKSRVAETLDNSRTAYVNVEGAKVYNAKGKAVGTLSLNAQVTVTGVNGRICRIQVGGRTGYMNAGELSAKKVSQADTASEQTEAAPSGSAATPARGTAKEMDWWTSDIQKIFARGVTVTVTDVETGLAWHEQRRGGTNHADVQPCTAADTAALKQAYGGAWSWTRRAVFVTIDGVNYAASMNGMPHGGGAITDNNFNGHHCIHFTNSRTHGSNRICELHQAAIRKALQAKL